jgi:hypothetical protein
MLKIELRRFRRTIKSSDISSDFLGVHRPSLTCGQGCALFCLENQEGVHEDLS